jgi:glutathione S-transferase
MTSPTVFGAAYSVYVRIVRLALAEKGVAYRLVDIDIFAPGGPPQEYVARHPFGRIPAFEHDGFRLYETGAIARYVDEAFDGPPLQPADVRRRAHRRAAITAICAGGDIRAARAAARRGDAGSQRGATPGRLADRGPRASHRWVASSRTTADSAERS